MSRSKFKTQFQLHGRILSLDVSSKGKLKSVNLLDDRGTHRIKLGDRLRKKQPSLQPGEWVSLTGIEKRNLKNGKVKLKAKQIRPGSKEQVAIAAPNPDLVVPKLDVEPQPEPPTEIQKPPCGKVLVCQKSKCRKRGGAEVCSTLKNTLSHLGLDESIQVQPTGCLKRCKQAPNLVVMPDKSRHSNIQPEDIPALVEQHFVQAG